MKPINQRILTAAVLVPIALGVTLYAGTVWVAIVAGLFFLASLYEWGRIIGLKGMPLRCTWVAIGALLLAALWELRGASLLRATLWVATAWWLIAFCWLQYPTFAEKIRKTHSALKAVAGLLIVLPAWLALVELHASSPDGPKWVIFVFGLVWCADISAFFIGRRFGSTKLAPSISPGKTRAGAYGAMIGSLVYALIAGLAIRNGRGVWVLAALCMVTVAFSIVGDLFESLLKRHARLKDSGSVLPGHGGFLDRLDSLFAALPIFVLGKIALAL